jgi:hypothetical protein
MVKVPDRQTPGYTPRIVRVKPETPRAHPVNGLFTMVQLS